MTRSQSGVDSTSEQESTESSDSTPTNQQSGNGSLVETGETQIFLDTPTLDEIISERSDFERLGKGTYGRVYKYICPRTNNTVALKHLTAAKVQKCGKIAEKFQQELEIHKDMDHKNIVKFYTSIKDENVGNDGALVLVLEYVERGSLHDLMKRGLLERCRILTHAAQILQGLDYLHNFTDGTGQRRPIVHRDLRCANVLLTADNVVKIADFGLCKRLHEMARASGIDSRLGNPYWYAPELVDRSKRVGRSISTLARTDIWSLGVLILELYYYGCHRIPYIDHYRELEYIFKLGNGWVPKSPKAAPPEIKLLLDKCLEYCVDRRPSAKKVLEIINNFDLTKRANLRIDEPIHPPLVIATSNSTSSSSETTPESYATVTESLSDGFGSDTYVKVDAPLEVGPVDPDEDEDARYLTLRFDRKMELRQRYLDDPQISQLNDYSVELISFVSRGKESFTLEDCLERKGMYVVKKGNTDEEVFRIIFDDEGKLLTVKQREKSLFSIDSPDEKKGFLSTSNSKGGIAQLNGYSTMKKKMTKKRMKIKSVTSEGARVLDAMSPTMNRANPPSASPLGNRTPSSLTRSVYSMMSIRYDNRSLAVKKNKQPSEHYYKIKFREDNVVMAHFTTFIPEGRCEISVTPDSNSALVATVVAYYYRVKSRKKRSGFVKNLFNWRRTSSYGQITDS